MALASASKAILSYRTGKRDGANTEALVFDLRERVLGSPEISTDGWTHYTTAIRWAFGNRIAHAAGFAREELGIFSAPRISCWR
jgi:hypothetical protein